MLIICYNMFMETFDKISDWKQLQVFIKNENLDGAEITFLMDDIHKHTIVTGKHIITNY